MSRRSQAEIAVVSVLSDHQGGQPLVRRDILTEARKVPVPISLGRRAVLRLLGEKTSAEAVNFKNRHIAGALGRLVGEGQLRTTTVEHHHVTVVKQKIEAGLADPSILDGQDQFLAWQEPGYRLVPQESLARRHSEALTFHPAPIDGRVQPEYQRRTI